MAYIYKLLDENGDPFYVGKSVDPKKRLAKHVRRAKDGEVYPVSAKIRKLLRQGYRPRVEIIEEADDDAIDEREQHYIKALRDEGFRLSNIAAGGEGGKGITPEIAKKIVATRMRNGYRHSDETKRKLSESHRGKVLSDEHKAALSRAWSRTPEQWAEIGPKISASCKGKSHIKKYICTAPDGVEYVTDRGLTVFCEEHGLHRPKMCSLANGKLKSYRGWQCRHAEESE